MHRKSKFGCIIVRLTQMSVRPRRKDVRMSFHECFGGLSGSCNSAAITGPSCGLSSSMASLYSNKTRGTLTKCPIGNKGIREKNERMISKRGLTSWSIAYIIHDM